MNATQILGERGRFSEVSPINILFLIYDLERGGPELRLLDFARHFPSDIKMHICVTSENLALLPGFFQANAVINVVPITKVYLELNKAWRIYRYVRANRISIINSFNLKELFLSTAIKAFSGWRLTIVHHSVDLLHYYGTKQKALLGVFLKSIDAVLCNSEMSRKLVKKFFVSEKKITVINNGIDFDVFSKTKPESHSLKRQCGIRENEVVLGTIANFTTVKNYPFLLNAFRILSRRHANLRLICVGGGYLLDEMKQLSRSYGLGDKVIFTGYSKDVEIYLSLMDIFLLCSLREGLPNVILQAMSMEIPVVSSNVGGCPEIIDNMTNGILYPSNNIDKFIEAVERLLKDRNLASRLGVNGRKTVVEKFSLNTMIENYSEFYRELSRR